MRCNFFTLNQENPTKSSGVEVADVYAFGLKGADWNSGIIEPDISEESHVQLLGCTRREVSPIN